MIIVAEPELIAPRPSDVLPRGDDWIFEPKWDGYRAVISATGREVELRSRRGTDLSELFPDITRSAMVQLETGSIFDAELVVFVDGTLSFDALQHRMAAGLRRADNFARVQPASLMIFDVLRHAGDDVTGLPWKERRTIIEELSADWRPPIQLTPFTTSRDEATEWMTALAPMGIEGIVAKRSTGRYRRGTASRSDSGRPWSASSAL